MAETAPLTSILRSATNLDGTPRKPCPSWAWALSEGTSGSPTQHREYCVYSCANDNGHRVGNDSKYSCSTAGDGISSEEFKRRQDAWDNR